MEDLRRKLLTRNRDLLIYAFTDEQLYMLVIGVDTAALLKVPAGGVADAVRALNAAVISREHAPYVQAAHGLYQLVFAPIAHLLKKPELLIIPDGDLQTVNFEMLLTEPDAKDFIKNLLIQRYAIAYLLSATTAVQFSELAHDRAKGVLAMAPGFTDELKQDYLAQMKDSTLIDRQYLGLSLIHI